MTEVRHGRVQHPDLKDACMPLSKEPRRLMGCIDLRPKEVREQQLNESPKIDPSAEWEDNGCVR